MIDCSVARPVRDSSPYRGADDATRGEILMSAEVRGGRCSVTAVVVVVEGGVSSLFLRRPAS